MTSPTIDRSVAGCSSRSRSARRGSSRSTSRRTRSRTAAPRGTHDGARDDARERRRERRRCPMNELYIVARGTSRRSPRVFLPDEESLSPSLSPSRSPSHHHRHEAARALAERRHAERARPRPLVPGRAPHTLHQRQQHPHQQHARRPQRRDRRERRARDRERRAQRRRRWRRRAPPPVGAAAPAAGSPRLARAPHALHLKRRGDNTRRRRHTAPCNITMCHNRSSGRSVRISNVDVTSRDIILDTP